MNNHSCALGIFHQEELALETWKALAKEKVDFYVMLYMIGLLTKYNRVVSQIPLRHGRAVIPSK